MAGAIAKLDQAGAAADGVVVRYQAKDVQLGEAYTLFAENLLEALSGTSTTVNRFNPFVFGFG
jgi:hypothetical protein